MNSVTLVGRIARDPEVRATNTGKSVCNFNLAVDKKFARNRAENEPTADFIPCVAWDKTADFIGKYFKKGSGIAIKGYISTRTYETDAGEKRYVVEVVINEAEFTPGSKNNNDGGFEQPKYGNSQPRNNNNRAMGSEFGKSYRAQPDEEIPF